MFSNLLVLAAAAGGLTQITDTFGINLPAILAQVVSFSVVAYVLWRFAFKPVLATMDERQQKIEAGLKYTEEMKAKLEATQQESAALIQQAQEKASAIIHETRQTAKEYLDKQTQEAAQKANDLMVKAQQAIELERRKMISEARAEIASLVVTTTERVLAKKLSEAERASYNESAARELTIA